MVSHPELLTDFALAFVWLVLFSAFNQNVYLTTLILGQKLYGTEPNKTGVQDAITPAWQSRNTFITYGLLAIFFGICLFIFKWYLGIAIFIAMFFIAIPLVSKFLMFPPCSVFIVKKIRNDLVKRHSAYADKGDQIRTEAITDVINRLDAITQLD